MFRVIFVSLFGALLSSTIASPASNAGSDGLKGKLVFAQVLFRHGDRTPVEPYPTDPWKDVNDWPTGWGQLTNIGKNQHYQLGRWLRHRYSSILNTTYSKNEVYIRSTDVDRTLMSAESNLAGLFQPEDKQIWNKNIAWQPIPVHTIPEKEDAVLSAKKPCNAYDYELSKVRNSDEFQKLDAQFSYLYKYLSEHTGKNINSLEGVQKINNTLTIEAIYNKTLPEWTEKVFPGGDMKFIADFSFATTTYTRKLARLKTGRLVKEMFKHFQEKANSKLKPNRALWMYSAHDTTIANLLNTLKLFEYHSPPYASCVLLELRIIEKQPFVSVFYKNTTAEPIPMVIPNCGIQCPLSKMYELYDDVIPDDWEAECKLSMLSLTYEEADVGSAMIILVGITSLVLLMVLIYIASLYYRRRQYANLLSIF